MGDQKLDNLLFIEDNEIVKVLNDYLGKNPKSINPLLRRRIIYTVEKRIEKRQETKPAFFQLAEEVKKYLYALSNTFLDDTENMSSKMTVHDAIDMDSYYFLIEKTKEANLKRNEINEAGVKQNILDTIKTFFPLAHRKSAYWAKPMNTSEESSGDITPPVSEKKFVNWGDLVDNDANPSKKQPKNPKRATPMPEEQQVSKPSAFDVTITPYNADVEQFIREQWLSITKPSILIMEGIWPAFERIARERGIKETMIKKGLEQLDQVLQKTVQNAKLNPILHYVLGTKGTSFGLNDAQSNRIEAYKEMPLEMKEKLTYPQIQPAITKMIKEHQASKEENNKSALTKESKPKKETEEVKETKKPKPTTGKAQQTSVPKGKEVNAEFEAKGDFSNKVFTPLTESEKAELLNLERILKIKSKLSQDVTNTKKKDLSDEAKAITIAPLDDKIADIVAQVAITKAKENLYGNGEVQRWNFEPGTTNQQKKIFFGNLGFRYRVIVPKKEKITEDKKESIKDNRKYLATIKPKTATFNNNEYYPISNKYYIGTLGNSLDPFSESEKKEVLEKLKSPNLRNAVMNGLARKVVFIETLKGQELIKQESSSDTARAVRLIELLIKKRNNNPQLLTKQQKALDIQITRTQRTLAQYEAEDQAYHNFMHENFSGVRNKSNAFAFLKENDLFKPGHNNNAYWMTLKVDEKLTVLGTRISEILVILNKDKKEWQDLKTLPRFPELDMILQTEESIVNGDISPITTMIAKPEFGVILKKITNAAVMLKPSLLSEKNKQKKGAVPSLYKKTAFYFALVRSATGSLASTKFVNLRILFEEVTKANPAIAEALTVKQEYARPVFKSKTAKKTN